MNETNKALVSLVNRNSELQNINAQLRDIKRQQALELNFLQSFIKKQIMDLNNSIPDHISNICKQQLSNCPVCLQAKDDYKFIRCGHLLCETCLTTIQNMSKQHRKCPVCREKIKYKLKELDHLFDNYIMYDLNRYQEQSYDIENSKSEITRFTDDEALQHEYDSDDDDDDSGSDSDSESHQR